jgi:hypothetical protein
MFRKFKFEESLCADMREIPFSTRFKMDEVGLRIETSTWRKLPLEERNVLCHLSVRSQGERDAYREFLILSVKRSGAKEAFPENSRLESDRSMWENPGRMPSLVAEASFGAGIPVRPEDWLNFDDMERYTLFQISKERPEWMSEALKEFLRGNRFKNGPTMKAVNGL